MNGLSPYFLRMRGSSGDALVAGECTKGLVINYGEGGTTKWENCGSESFCAPPPQDRVKLFAPTPLRSGNF